LRGNATERVATSCIKANSCFSQHHSSLTQWKPQCKGFEQFFSFFLMKVFSKEKAY